MFKFWGLSNRLMALPMLVLLLLAGSAPAQTTSFTYQGRLLDGGTPANGSYDLRFALFDTLGGGSQIGTTLTRSSVAVSGGVFTVHLDFALSAFPGADRFLQISVRAHSADPETPAYTLLTPREQFDSTPYAIRAAVAGFAETSNAVTGVTAGTGLSGGGTGGTVTINIADSGVNTLQLANGAVTTAKIPIGQVVKGLNGLQDNVSLAAGSGINITLAGNTLTITNTGGGGGGGVPVGTIVAYAGPISTIPVGWLVCDGASISRTLSATLFSAIGTSWGNGDGSTTFNLPDLSGRFLRGVDKDATGTPIAIPRDPDRDGRTATNAGGNTGNNVGTLETDEFAAHTHNAASNQSFLLVRVSQNPLPTTNAGGMGATPPVSPITASSGGNETRPKNAYVIWIIKAN